MTRRMLSWAQVLRDTPHERAADASVVLGSCTRLGTSVGMRLWRPEPEGEGFGAGVEVVGLGTWWVSGDDPQQAARDVKEIVEFLCLALEVRPPEDVLPVPAASAAHGQATADLDRPLHRRLFPVRERPLLLGELRERGWLAFPEGRVPALLTLGAPTPCAGGFVAWAGISEVRWGRFFGETAVTALANAAVSLRTVVDRGRWFADDMGNEVCESVIAALCRTVSTWRRPEESFGE